MVGAGGQKPARRYSELPWLLHRIPWLVSTEPDRAGYRERIREIMRKLCKSQLNSQHDVAAVRFTVNKKRPLTVGIVLFAEIVFVNLFAAEKSLSAIVVPPNARQSAGLQAKVVIAERIPVRSGCHMRPAHPGGSLGLEIFDVLLRPVHSRKHGGSQAAVEMNDEPSSAYDSKNNIERTGAQMQWQV